MSGGIKRSDVRPAQDVYWAVDELCTLVVNEKRSEVFRLSGMEQVLWDCLEMRYTLEQVRQTLSALEKVEPEVAEQMLIAVLQEWHMLGLVEIEESPHG